MTTVFRRDGLGFRYEPDGVGIHMVFSHFDRRETAAEVRLVHAPSNQTIMHRRINLLAASGRTGSVADLAKELADEVRGVDWKKLLREACESALAAFRAGRPAHKISGEIQRPPPPAWMCDGLLLKGKPNVWIGAASTGKSTLAKAMCVYYAAGYQFCGRPMEQGVPLYLDWEDDRESFERVAYDVCRNLGVWPIPPMYWLDMHGLRLRDQVEHLCRLVDQYGVGCVVLDAVAAAGGSPGEHMSWEGVALELEQVLGLLPSVTVLGLDHVTSAEHKDNGVVPLKARGAERKVEFFRCQWSLVVDRGEQDMGRHVVSWTNTKLNLGPKGKPFVTELLHRDADLSIVVRELDASPEAIDRMSAQERVVHQLRATPGLSVNELCAALYDETPKAKVESVRTQLKRAERRGQAWEAAGRWWATDSRHSGQNGQASDAP